MQRFSIHDLRKLTLLYVEDDAVVLDAMTPILAKFVGTLRTAASGRKGLESFLNERPDLVLSDIRMPEMDGMEMLRAIREHDGLVPVILNSALSETEMVLDAIAAGADDFVAKPTDIERLLDVLLRHGERAAALRRGAEAAELLEGCKKLVGRHAAFFSVDGQERIVYASEAFHGLLGYGAGTLAGREVAEIVNGTLPEQDGSAEWGAVLGLRSASGGVVEVRAEAASPGPSASQTLWLVLPVLTQKG